MDRPPLKIILFAASLLMPSFSIRSSRTLLMTASTYQESTSVVAVALSCWLLSVKLMVAESAL